jgi:hypothetical protein
MASIYDKASLVLIPSGTKTSKVYSQKPVNGDGDFTFSRSTAATRVNADGNIEKETQNLLPQSNSFNTSPWNLAAATLTSGQTGYDGSNDAWLLSATSSFANVNQNVSLSNLITFSVYAKAGTGDWMVMRLNGTINNLIYVDLTNQVFGGGGGVARTITDIGNGWSRVSITINQASYTAAHIYVAAADGSISTTNETIYIQDAQIEQGLVARDYIETTTAAVEGGITDNVPRLDYTDSSCPALLLEPQRRNLVRHSEYIGGLEVGHTPTISIESVTNPEGYSFAYKVVSVNTSSRVQDNIGTQGNNMVFSGFFKGTGTATRLRFRNNQGAQVQYNIDSSGDFSLQFEDAVNDNYGIEDYGNGWHRIYFETTTESAADNYIQVYPDSENGTGSVYVWGLQVEDNGAGGGSSYATSYIPTYGTSVTRNDDACFGAGNTATFNSTEGVLYFEGSAISSNDSTFKRIAIGTSDLNFVNNINLRYDTSGTSVTYQYRAGNVYQADLTIPINQTDVNKIACVWKVNRFEIWLNGVKAAEDTSGSVISANTLETMYYGKTTTFSEPLYGKTNQVLVFPTALSDEELAALTTI